MRRGVRQGSGLADRNRFVDNDENSEFLDLSGDVEFGVGPGSLKLIGLNRTSHKPTSQQVITDYIDLTPDQGNRNQVLSDTLERVSAGGIPPGMGWRLATVLRKCL